MSILVKSSTILFITALTFRGSIVFRQSRASTLFLIICDKFEPLTLTWWFISNFALSLKRKHKSFFLVSSLLSLIKNCSSARVKRQSMATDSNTRHSFVRIRRRAQGTGSWEPLENCWHVAPIWRRQGTRRRSRTQSLQKGSLKQTC